MKDLLISKVEWWGLSDSLKVLRPSTGLISKLISHKLKSDKLISHKRGIKLWNFIFDKRLFQLNAEKCCLFSTSVWHGTKKGTLSANLGLPENMSHRSVLALNVQYFSLGLLSPSSQSVSLNWV